MGDHMLVSMDKDISRIPLALIALVVGIVASGLAVGGLAMVGSAATTMTFDRNFEPVVVTGMTVGALTGFPVNQLFVYAYSGGVWRQIPAQVDEVTATGDYTTTEDSLLNANDEIVFMAKDLGEQAPVNMPITASLPISLTWYEIEVNDPISPTQRGWAYLVRSRVLTQTLTADYVGFDPATHRIHGEIYSLGFATPRPWADYLTLGNSGVDILDRTKMRLNCIIPLICPITEDKGLPLQDHLIKDGPVRVIVRGGRVLAYGSLLSWTTSISIARLFAGDIRFSIDFNQAVTGSIYYNAVVPGGVTVNGITDTVPAVPLSPWWQVSTSHGTLVQVADATSIGGV